MSHIGGCWYMTQIGNPSQKDGPLKWQPRTLPAAGRSDVVVKVKACALNPIDFKIANGMFNPLIWPPFCPGVDFAGEVVDAGSNTGYTKGQKIFGIYKR